MEQRDEISRLESQRSELLQSLLELQGTHIERVVERFQALLPCCVPDVGPTFNWRSGSGGICP